MAPGANHAVFEKLSQATFQKLLQERLRLAIQFTLITILEEEVEGFCNAERYQRPTGRQDYPNGTCERNLGTTVG